MQLPRKHQAKKIKVNYNTKLSYSNPNLYHNLYWLFKLLLKIKWLLKFTFIIITLEIYFKNIYNIFLLVFVYKSFVLNVVVNMSAYKHVDPKEIR